MTRPNRGQGQKWQKSEIRASANGVDKRCTIKLRGRRAKSKGEKPLKGTELIPDGKVLNENPKSQVRGRGPRLGIKAERSQEG